MTMTTTRPPDAAEPTLHRLLQERLLRGAQVLRGVEELSRPVRWCHSLHDVLRDHPGELSGVVLLIDAAELADVGWDELMGYRSAAVFVRGDIVGPVPPSAHGAGRPAVVQLPSTVSFTAVQELVAMLSLAHRAHVLQYGQQVHAALAHLMHRGAGLTALCSRLARLSQTGVAVVGTDLHLLAFDPGPDRAIEPASVAVALRESEQQLLALAGSASSPHHVVTLELTVRDEPIACVAGAIDLVDHRDGWVVLLDASKDLTEHDLAEHRVAVEQAVTIFGTELLRVRGIERAEERAKGNFVHALLHARFTNRADMVARASHHDFDVDGRYGVVVAHSGALVAQRDSPSKLADMARDATRLLEDPRHQTLATVVGDVVVVVRKVSPAQRGRRDPGRGELRDYSRALENKLREHGHKTVVVAFGSSDCTADSIVDSYREARIALDLRHRLGVEEVCGFADLLVHSVLLDLAQQQAGRAFVDEILGPLHHGRDSELVEVARVYVDAGGNLNEAARRMNVHRNTMLYKLDRITRLLQRDMRAADTQFAVGLAIRLSDLAETTQRVNRDLSSG